MKMLIAITVMLEITMMSLKSNELQLKEKIYEAYISGNINKWYQISSLFESSDLKKNIPLNEQEEILGVYYGLIAYYISQNQKKNASKLLEKATSMNEQLLKSHPHNARLNAMRGAFLGFEIGLNPLKAPFIGLESLDYIDKALMADNQNPYAWLEKANSLYYAPLLIGNSQKKAFEAYQKSISLFEKQQITRHNWIYLNTITSLARAYEEQADFTNAITLYKKILTVEPSFDWVKNELLPNVLKKQKAV